MILSLTFFHKTWPPEELLNHKEVNYFFMPNFHDVMSNLWWVCRKDMSEGHVGNDTKNQIPGYNQKTFFEPKGLFRTNTLFDKNFLNCFSYKVWEKKSLRVKTFVLCKRLKNKQIVIPMHHFIIRLPLKPCYLPKDQIWCKITFLNENTTFLEIFAMEFINKLEFWDSAAMIPDFITEPIPRLVSFNRISIFLIFT